MDRGQAHIQRQQRGRSFCKRGRQQRCHRFAVADRLHQDGPGGRGRVGRDCGWSQADNFGKTLQPSLLKWHMRVADEHEVMAWEHVYGYDQRNSKFEVVAATSQKAALRFGFEVGAAR